MSLGCCVATGGALKQGVSSRANMTPQQFSGSSYQPHKPSGEEGPIFHFNCKVPEFNVIGQVGSHVHPCTNNRGPSIECSDWQG